MRASPESAWCVGLVDPFDERAHGAKISDFCTMKTATIVLKATPTITVSGTGTGAWAFVPPEASGVYYLAASADVAGAITWPTVSTSQIPNWANTSGGMTVYRVVSWGVRMMSDEAVGTAKGHIHVGQFARDMTVDLYGYTDFPATEAQFAEGLETLKVSVSELTQRPLVVSAKIQDTGITSFRDPLFPSSTTRTGGGSDGWPAIVMCAAGMNASASITFEYIAHVEFLPAPSGYFLSDTEACLYNPNVLTVASQITEQQPTAFLQGDVSPSYLENIERTVDNVISNVPRVISIGSKVYGAAKAAFQTIGYLSPYMLRY